MILICNCDPFGRGKAVCRFRHTEKDEKKAERQTGEERLMICPE